MNADTIPTTPIERVYVRIEHERRFLANSYPTVVRSLDVLRQDIDAAIVAEREACAKVAMDLVSSPFLMHHSVRMVAEEIAESIRRRSSSVGGNQT